MKRIQKYAVFPVNTRYILQDIDKITNQQKQTFLQKKNINQNISIYFHYFSSQWWCIKNRNYFTHI